jgi:hypothetical protein
MLGLCLDLPVIATDAFIKHAHLIEQVADGAPGERGQCFRRLHRLTAHRDRAQRQNHTELRHQPAQPIDDRGALDDESLAHPVHRKQRLLFGRFHRHEAHVRARPCLADRFGIVAVVLAALAVRDHELGRHQSHRMSESLKPAAPFVRSRAGFHADQARRQTGHDPQQLVAPHRASQYHPTDAINCVQREDTLCQIDSHGSDLFHDFPSRLRLMTTPLQSWHFDAGRFHRNRVGEVPFIR